MAGKNQNRSSTPKRLARLFRDHILRLIEDALEACQVIGILLLLRAVAWVAHQSSQAESLAIVLVHLGHEVLVVVGFLAFAVRRLTRLFK